MSEIDFSDPAVLAALSAALTQAGVDCIEIEQPRGKLRIVVEKNGGASVLINAAKGVGKDVVRGQLAGVFTSYQTPSRSLSGNVATGEILGFIRVGPILLPVKVGKAGTLTRALAENNSLVGYGDPLFEIESHS
ncbi:acetyl-CoA carboxylase [Agrobacterium rosae]|uniref:acetyl-CoA carboxylase n=1 Tax=Agrobacterium rosae TaxID=1972867 RepID=UPI00122F7B51|nr:acetyl-CoA carboxylase [Agrobacterium rosae]KAA3509623.1 acetyl-CoA carboxylase [Agrobacterium rosae]KAA3516524.1 acetyl-CoA carboxylase [Agrobacterium rosae]MQB50325.1 acetyl-CoA carboxylase [Agrobacterium rosae]